MKIKLSIFLPLITCAVISAHAASSGRVGAQSESLQLLQDKDGNQILVRSFPSATSAITTVGKEVTFDKIAITSSNGSYSVFVAANFFGASATATEKAYAISLVSAPATAAGVTTVALTGLTPEATTVAPITVNGTEITTNSPLHGKLFDKLAYYSSYPIVTYIGNDGSIDYTLVAMVTDLTAGKTILATPAPVSGLNSIRDAEGSGVVNKIPALASDTTYIYAAVPYTDGNWSDYAGDNRGIALIKKATSELTVLNATNVNDTDAANIKATKLDVAASAKIAAFYAAFTTGITKARVGQDVDMHYDSTLGRLFIALSNVRRDDTAKEGGVLGVCMGYVDGTEFKIKPIIYQRTTLITPTSMTSIFNATNKQIVGNYLPATDQNDAQVSVRKVRTMHTSTGYTYMILNSIMQNSPKAAGGGLLIEDVIDGVFALPLVDTVNNGATLLDQSITSSAIGTLAKVVQATGVGDIGTDAKNDGYFAPVYADADKNSMPTLAVTAGSIPLTVGGNYAPDGGYINDMFVEGDTVFICLNGYKANEAGIFASTALFNNAGLIRGWTPWQRVMGGMERVWGGKLNPATGNFYGLTAQGNLPVVAGNTAAKMNTLLADYYKNSNTVRISAWGKSDTVTASDSADNDHTPQNNMTSALGDGYNIRGVAAFDEFTPGFKNGKFGMEVFWDYDGNVSLMQTGEYNNGMLTPVANFVFDTVGKAKTHTFWQTATDIGTITCAEVIRIAPNTTSKTSGYLFVGGISGVAVLNNPTGNVGWPTDSTIPEKSGLGSLNTGSVLDDFTFFPLENAAGEKYDIQVVKLCADGKKALFVLATDKLYKLADATGDWRLVELKSAGTQEIFTNMMLLSDKLGIVTSTKGVYTFDPSAATVTFATLSATTNAPYYCICYLPASKGGPVVDGGTATTHANGNLYVMLSDYAGTDYSGVPSGKVYRYDVSGTTPTPTTPTSSSMIQGTDAFVDFSDFRSGFVSDGAISLITSPKFVGNDSLLSIAAISNAASGSAGIPSAASDMTTTLEDVTSANRVGQVVRDPISGAWLVTTSVGVRVNQ